MMTTTTLAEGRILNPATGMDAVTLRVGDLELMSSYYAKALALEPIEEQSHGREVHRVLGRNGVPFVRLVATPGLPGVDPSSIDLDVERNVVTVNAHRESISEDVERLASERPRGHFSRQLVLGENVDTDNITANYADGVLALEIPVAESAKPRKIEVSHGNGTKSITS